jgi:hypothetical protein
MFIHLVYDGMGIKFERRIHTNLGTNKFWKVVDFKNGKNIR